MSFTAKLEALSNSVRESAVSSNTGRETVWIIVKILSRKGLERKYVKTRSRSHYFISAFITRRKSMWRKLWNVQEQNKNRPRCRRFLTFYSILPNSPTILHFPLSFITILHLFRIMRNCILQLYFILGKIWILSRILNVFTEKKKLKG